MLFFFYDTATTEIYTLSLHDALPISGDGDGVRLRSPGWSAAETRGPVEPHANPTRVSLCIIRDETMAPGARSNPGDRKSTRLNSSHSQISYAVFCLKKKNKVTTQYTP